MPVTKSAEKANRQSLKKRSRNKHFLALYRESLKAFEKSLKDSVGAANTALSDLQSKVDTLVKKNVLHKNTAARKKSSFAKMVAKLGSSITSSVVATKTKKEAPAKAAKTPVKPKTEKTEVAEKATEKKPTAKKTGTKKATSKSAE